MPIFLTSFMSVLECTNDAHCKEAHKGICVLSNKTCGCDIGYIKNGSQCFGKFSPFNVIALLFEQGLTLLTFFLECIVNDHCQETNKGICNLDTNTCSCNIGYFEDGFKCIGEFNLQHSNRAHLILSYLSSRMF